MSCSKCFFDTKKIVLFSSSPKVEGIGPKIPSAQWQGMSDSTARSNSANFDKICPIFHAARQIFPHLQMSFPDHTGCCLTPVVVEVVWPLMIYHKILTDFCAIITRPNVSSCTYAHELPAWSTDQAQITCWIADSIMRRVFLRSAKCLTKCHLIHAMSQTVSCGSCLACLCREDRGRFWLSFWSCIEMNLTSAIVKLFIQTVKTVRFLWI